MALAIVGALLAVSLADYLGRNYARAPTMQVDTYIVAEHVDNVSQNETVIEANDPRIQDVQPIQSVLKKATLAGTSDDVAISSNEKEQTVDVLQRLPKTENQTGVLVSYDCSVYCVSLSEYL